MLLKIIFNRPTTSRENHQPRIIAVPQRQAGVVVDHDTAMKLSAVWGCVRYISETIACLSWHVLQDQPNGNKKRLIGVPVANLLNKRPNPELTPFSFKELITAWALTWGNGYAEIVRDGANRPAELWPIAPDRVEVRRDETGELYYEVSNARGPKTNIPANNMFHLHGLGFDGLVGYSVISYAARSIGLGLATEAFGSSFFGNGARIGGVVTVPQQSNLNDQGKRNLKKSLNEKHGGPENGLGIEVLDAGMDYKQIGIPPEDAQFIETRKLQVEEICRWFRVKPHKIAHLDRATFNNMEQESRDSVGDSIMPWAIRLEQEADKKLITTPRIHTKLILKSLLRADTKTQTEHYQAMLDRGVYSINKVLELEDQNTIGPDGDKRFVPLNMTTLDKAGEDNTQNQQPSNPDPQPAQIPQNIIKERIKGILNKEYSRINGLKTRYKRQEYIDRVCGFLGGNRAILRKEYAAILDLCELPEKEITYGAKICADNHINQSREQAINFYDNNIFEIENRTDNVVDGLVKVIDKYIYETNKINEVQNG